MRLTQPSVEIKVKADLANNFINVKYKPIRILSLSHRTDCHYLSVKEKGNKSSKDQVYGVASALHCKVRLSLSLCKLPYLTLPYLACCKQVPQTQIVSWQSCGECFISYLNILPWKCVTLIEMSRLVFLLLVFLLSQFPKILGEETIIEIGITKYFHLLPPILLKSFIVFNPIDPGVWREVLRTRS